MTSVGGQETHIHGQTDAKWMDGDIEGQMEDKMGGWVDE